MGGVSAPPGNPAHGWGAGSGFERLVAALEEHDCGPIRNGKARCPAHEDRTPSLAVEQGERGAVLYCHAGCEIENILRALGLDAAELFDDAPEKTKRVNGEQRKRIVRTYEPGRARRAALPDGALRPEGLPAAEARQLERLDLESRPRAPRALPAAGRAARG